MQNNTKTELHMQCDPQMRRCVQLFCSVVTITLFPSMLSMRRSLQLFCGFKVKLTRRLNFRLIVKTRNASEEQKKKNQDICSWPSRTGVLQSSKTEAVLPKSEWMIQSIGCKAVSRIVAKYIFQKDISLNLKILGYAEKKKGF